MTISRRSKIKNEQLVCYYVVTGLEQLYTECPLRFRLTRPHKSAE